VTGLTVATPRVKEATAQGCAAAAATGAGLFYSLREAGNAWSQIEAEFTPNPDLHALYSDASARWAKAYAVQRELVTSHVTTSMWQAPGT
jgi:autoinducer 2 (AI-2) kinase